MGPINLWQLLTGGNAAPPEAMGPQVLDGEQFPGTIVPGAPKRFQQQIPPPQPTTVTPEMGTVPAGPVEPPYRGPASMPGKPAAGAPPGVMATGATNPARDEIAEMLRTQEGEIDRQRELYDQAAGMEPQMDLRPIAAFVDSMTDGKSAAAAAPTFTAADKLKLMSQLRENVAQGQEKLTSAKLRQALGDEGLDMRKMQMLMNANRQTATSDNKSIAREDRFHKNSLDFSEKLARNPVAVKLAEKGVSFNELGALSKLAKEGNLVSFSGMGIKMAKAMGETGVLTEQDVTRYVDTKQISQRAANVLSKWRDGRPADATMADIDEIANAMKQAASDDTVRIQDDYAKRLHRNFKEFVPTMKDAYYYLGVDREEPAPKSGGKEAPAAKGAAVPAGGLTPEEKAELEALRKKKAGGQ